MSLQDEAALAIKVYDEWIHPLLARYQKARVPQFDKEVTRLQEFLATPEKELSICVLGQSGVGKSTLINSLVDPQHAVLPQGGVGPLTALATKVRFNEKRQFSVRYLKGNAINNALFALEKHSQAVASKPVGEILDKDDDAAVEAAAAEAIQGSKLKELAHQLCLMVRGDQYANVSLPYLLKALKWVIAEQESDADGIESDDLARLRDLRRALAIAKSKDNEHRVVLGADAAEFYRALHMHAAGHLAPLVQTIEVGWDAPMLKDGLVLVDLPGLGVANDEYREVTTAEIRSARAVVLVVDRSGFTEASAELLRSTGFLNALLHDSGDAEAELRALHVAVVKLDMTADDERRKAKALGHEVKPWVEYFDDACRKAVVLLKDQVGEVLRRHAGEVTGDTQSARMQMVDSILSTMQVHTVASLEYRKFMVNDSDDKARVQAAEQSHVPQTAEALQRYASEACQKRIEALDAALRGFHARVADVLEMMISQWKSATPSQTEIENLRSAVTTAVAPLRDEYHNRRGAFREFLQSTIPQAIESGVVRATNMAKEDIEKYLTQVNSYHWATLRAAVKRGGTFVGARHIDLPSDLAVRFEEPVAVVWSKDILVVLRKRTRSYGDELVVLQSQLVKWSHAQGAKVSAARIERVHEEMKSSVANFGAVGKEAVQELKDRVRGALYAKVEAGVRRACKKFIDEKKEKGPGVKKRIEALLEELAPSVAHNAASAASEVLKTNYESVRGEIAELVGALPDPLETVASNIVEAHEMSVKKADTKLRSEVIAQLADGVGRWAQVSVSGK